MKAGTELPEIPEEAEDYRGNMIAYDDKRNLWKSENIQASFTC